MQTRIGILLLGSLMALTATLTLGAPAAHAEPPLPGCSDVSGDWRNIDPDTRAVTRVIASTNCYQSYHGTARVYGQCHPVDCDWGTTRIDAQPEGWWLGIYRTSTSTRYVWLKHYWFDFELYLRVYVERVYTDGRPNTISDEWMHRA